MNSVDVLIVDDHEVVREGLRAVLAVHPRLRVVGEAADGIEACAKSAALRPHVVIMDLSMPGMNGAAATRRVLAERPETQIIALTAHEEFPYVRELLEAGARGYVLKRSVLRSLRLAVEAVAAGGIFLDPELAKRQAPAAEHSTRITGELSTRETEVASLTARGYTNAEIGATLQISVKTVESHKTHLMAKLGLATRAQLVRYAVYCGWLSV